MKRMTMLATVALLAAAPGCKKEAPSAMSGGASAGSGSESASAPKPAADTAPAPAPAPAGPYSLPDGARTIDEHEARKADATALGTDVALRFVDKLGEDNDGFRRVDEMLVLSGTSSLIIQIAYDLDDAARHKGVADGTLALDAPLTPPRPFGKADAVGAPNLLPFTGPLLYLRHGKSGSVAVAQDGDTVTAWRLSITHGEGADGQVQDWFVQAKIQLAPGAKVVAH